MIFVYATFDFFKVVEKFDMKIMMVAMNPKVVLVTKMDVLILDPVL